MNDSKNNLESPPRNWISRAFAPDSCRHPTFAFFGPKLGEYSSTKREKFVLFIVLLSFTFLLYAPVLRFGFVNYDDWVFVTRNPIVKDGLSLERLKLAFQSFYIFWQPITWISYMVDAQIYHANASGYHLTNLLLHISNSLLVWAVLVRLSGAFYKSLAVAALFAWHPLNVESVVWISERKGLLAAFFFLLSLLVFLKFKINGKWWWYLLAYFLFALSLMSKPSMIAAPFAWIIINNICVRKENEGFVLPPPGDRSNSGEAHSPKIFGSHLIEMAPFALLSLMFVGLTFLAEDNAGSVVALTEVSVGSRIANALNSYGQYIRKCVCPTDLAVFYPLRDKWFLKDLLLPIVIVSGLTCAAFYFRKRFPFLAIGWIWYLCALVPVSGLVQVGVHSMADRYVYMPLIGVFCMAVWGLTDFLKRYRVSNVLLPAFFVVLLVLCLAGARAQSMTWCSSVALWSNAVRVNPQDHASYYALGTSYELLGDFQEARRHYAIAETLKPTTPGATGRLIRKTSQ